MSILYDGCTIITAVALIPFVLATLTLTRYRLLQHLFWFIFVKLEKKEHDSMAGNDTRFQFDASAAAATPADKKKKAHEVSALS